jgi:NAD(P)-dependent dehydrogenase (short-subunit alcohol dehydrogenase family)
MFGKTALVTGGASGLGLATVRKLNSRGAKILIFDLPSSDGQKVRSLKYHINNSNHRKFYSFI